MRLSRRSKYALLALCDLAGRAGNSPVPLKELAERNNIPPKFLEQIFGALRNAGLVRSQAGAHGGYTLGRPADQVTFGAVIRLLDGTLAPVSCVSQMAYEPCTCPDEPSCPVRAVMERVRLAIVAVVDNTTLADAVGQRRPEEALDRAASKAVSLPVCPAPSSAAALPRRGRRRAPSADDGP